MRIAYVSQPYPPMISGAAIVVENLARGMATRGHSTLVIAASDCGKAYTKDHDNHKVVRLCSVTNPARARQRFVLASRGKIRREIAGFRPHIIHIHDILSMGAIALRIGQRMQIPVIGTIHQLPWFICAYLPPYPGLQKLVERRLWAYGRWLNKQCELMIVPTPTISQIVDSRGGFHTAAISNGIDLARFTPTPEHLAHADRLYQQLGLDSEQPIILHVGRLDVEKRVDLVVRAAAKALKRTRAQLLVVGDGTCRSDLVDLAGDLGIGDRSFFPGYLDPETEIPDVYRIASVFVTASEIETQGLVLLEALASGIPVVAVDATCIPELITDKVNGHLVQAGDLGAMSSRILDILSDPAKARQMGMNGRKIAQGHAIDGAIDKHEDLYRSTIEAYQIEQEHHQATKVKWYTDLFGAVR